MKAFLEEFLPRLVPGWRHGEDFLLVPHEGKSDLDKSMPRKIKAWREPGARFVVVRDNDGADCSALKARLLQTCAESSRPVMVRLVCQELEAWYLASPEALQIAYPSCHGSIRKLAQRFPDPDVCIKPSMELNRLIPEFQKRDAARRMGRLLEPDGSRSASFRIFVAGVLRLVSGSSMECKV